MNPSFLSASVNEGFSGGEKKRGNEILQMARWSRWWRFSMKPIPASNNPMPADALGPALVFL